MSSFNDFIIQRAEEAGVSVRETFAGLIEILDEQTDDCPVCHRPATGEVEQQNSLFVEIFVGCNECQIYWYSHEESII